MTRSIRTASLAAAAAVALGAIGGSVGPAQAAGAFEVYGLHSPGLHVNSNSCRNVRVTASTSADPSTVEDIWATVDVWRGQKQIDNVTLEPVNGNVRKLAGSYFYCPYLDEVGRFRLGSTQVEWWDADYNSRTFIDTSRGLMTIKQAVRAGLSATRSGARRTFHSHAAYFAVGYGWHHYPKGVRVTLQRRPASGSGSWKAVASQRTTKHGDTTYTLRAAKTYQYRVVSAGTAHSWNLVGHVLIK